MSIDQTIISVIKQKKPLQNLDDSFVQHYLDDYFKKNIPIKKKLKEHDAKTLTKAKAFKGVVKEIRNELNRIYGVFWTGKNLTLEEHPSTKERIALYPVFYKQLFNITGTPKSIVDLGSGLNPLSYPYMHGFQGTYTAIELTKYDCERLQTLFQEKKLPIRVQQLDIFHDPLPKADMYFLFKLLDTIETDGHKRAEQLIRKIQAKHIIVSFATKTLRNQKMNHPHRGWIERMLTRLNYPYKLLASDNELFYIITPSYSALPTTA